MTVKYQVVVNFRESLKLDCGADLIKSELINCYNDEHGSKELEDWAVNILAESLSIEMTFSSEQDASGIRKFIKEHLYPDIYVSDQDIGVYLQ
ncbi:hypothetical protein [Vibrio rotiferianus]|uniref:hypothetical protein n=1 Tax=Vibrio rotiferianus TaxID=190895 RepID=UPI00397F3A40